eukprot:4749585-Alexandrium_andersonii.AAC.1
MSASPPPPPPPLADQALGPGGPQVDQPLPQPLGRWELKPRPMRPETARECPEDETPSMQAV